MINLIIIICIVIWFLSGSITAYICWHKLFKIRYNIVEADCLCICVLSGIIGILGMLFNIRLYYLYKD